MKADDRGLMAHMESDPRPWDRISQTNHPHPLLTHSDRNREDRCLVGVIDGRV